MNKIQPLVISNSNILLPLLAFFYFFLGSLNLAADVLLDDATKIQLPAHYSKSPVGTIAEFNDYKIIKISQGNILNDAKERKKFCELLSFNKISNQKVKGFKKRQDIIVPSLSGIRLLYGCFRPSNVDQWKIVKLTKSQKRLILKDDSNKFKKDEYKPETIKGEL